MTKYLTNKFLLKQRLFSLLMQEDEDTALILLVSLQNSYENFLDSFIGGKDSLSLEEVKAALYMREVRHRASENFYSQASGLAATDGERDTKLVKASPRSLGPNLTHICNYFKEK